MSERGLDRRERRRDVTLIAAGIVVGGFALLGARDLIASRSASAAPIAPAADVATALPNEAAPVQPASSESAVVVNGVALDEATLQAFTQRYGVGVRPGEYWYDPRTGAWGMQDGPAQGIIGAGMQLGGPLRADASGGGAGNLTGVYVNGRELHPIDVLGLMRIVQQPIVPGRYWLDANGVGGQEGGPAYFNLVALARQAGVSDGGGGGGHHCEYCGIGTVGGNGGFYTDHDVSVTR